MNIRFLETAFELEGVESLQRSIWPGDDMEIVPLHLLVAAAHNGGIILGAFDDERIVGFVFGFPGFDLSAGEPRLKHCSHMLGVLPEYRDRGVGFALKRAQWQVVRNQKIPRITWTYDPLQSRNAFFNIAKLGAVCDRYLEEHYGEMRDEINAGIPSDRFQVELWVNSTRVLKRLDRRPRRRLSLANFLQAGAEVINPATRGRDGHLTPEATKVSLSRLSGMELSPPLLLVEIPRDIQTIRAESRDLSLLWRRHSREIFKSLFDTGYLITDFVLPGQENTSSYYVLSHGEASLGRHVE